MSDLTVTFRATRIALTADAIRVKIARGPWVAELWVPKSVIDADSEVFGKTNVSGTLVLQRWWARDKGLVEPERRAGFPTKAGTRKAVSDALGVVVDTLKVHAAAFKLEAAAICECGECDEDDPVTWHVRRKLAELAEVFAAAAQ